MFLILWPIISKKSAFFSKNLLFSNVLIWLLWLQDLKKQSLRSSIKAKGTIFPRGVAPGDFIKYKKCKYMEDIRLIRDHLEANLNRASLNNLMDTLENIMEYNVRDEPGFLTLQVTSIF